MVKFEHYCERCGQGEEMFLTNGLCPRCGHDRVLYVKKIPRQIEKMGIKELLDN